MARSWELETLRARTVTEGDEVVAEFIDDGCSGARLDRPGLDALRDAAEAGTLDAIWCLSPDRLARSYAYQILILDELARYDVQHRALADPTAKAVLLVLVHRHMPVLQPGIGGNCGRS